MRRVTSGNPESAELAAINQSYKAAQRNYSHLAQLIEHLPIGYLRINILRDKTDRAVDYLLSYINQQAGRILGIRTQDFTGKTASETGVNPQENIPRFMHIPSGDSREHLWQAPDSGRYCRSLIYNTPNNDDELVILLEDITEARRNEEQLRRAKERAEESNRLKSAFLANMSHEIRTPLNAIVGFSELLAKEPRSKTRKEYSDIIRRNNELLLQIISDVLDLALIESGRSEVVRTTFDARKFVRETVEVFRPQCPPGVELRMEEELPPRPIRAYRWSHPDHRQLPAQRPEIHQGGVYHDRILRNPRLRPLPRPGHGHRHRPRRPRAHLRTLRQTRHLHAGNQTRTLDL